MVQKNPYNRIPGPYISTASSVLELFACQYITVCDTMLHTSRSVNQSTNLSTSTCVLIFRLPMPLSTYLPAIYPSIRLPTYPSIYRSVHLPTYFKLSTYLLAVQRSTYQSMEPYLTVSLPTSPSACPSVDCHLTM